MLYRKAYDKLLAWKCAPRKKALCIMGARQIGKTTVIRQFGKDQYERFVEVNFITQPDAVKIFDGNLDADSIIVALTAFTQTEMIPGKTLVLLDELLYETENLDALARELTSRMEHSASERRIAVENLKAEATALEQILED